MGMKVLSLQCRGVEVLKKYLSDFDVRCPEEADEEFISTAEVVLAHSWRKLQRFLPKMGNLRMIQAFTSGVDHFDFSKIPDGVLVCTNSGSNSWGVAEHAMALILAATKLLVWRHREMEEHRFPQMVESKLLRGKVVGLVGLGSVARELSSMLRGFGVHLMGVSRSGKCEFCQDFIFTGTMEQLDFLLSNSHIIILAIPLTRSTRGMINKERLERMKDDAILVNVARGKLIVEKDLYEHLLSHPNFVAALDTWWHYGEEFKQEYPFEKLPNVILSPHCAGSYEGWVEEMMRNAAENILLFSQGKPRNVVRKEDYL